MKALADDALDDISRLDEPFPASVTVTRTSQEDFGSRQVEVSIDGEHAGTLLWGDSLSRGLEPGPHRIRVHNTLVWKTVPFTLAPNEQLFFEVINHAGPGTYFFMLVFGVGPLYMTIRRMR